MALHLCDSRLTTTTTIKSKFEQVCLAAHRLLLFSSSSCSSNCFIIMYRDPGQRNASNAHNVSSFPASPSLQSGHKQTEQAPFATHHSLEYQKECCGTSPLTRGLETHVGFLFQTSQQLVTRPAGCHVWLTSKCCY